MKKRIVSFILVALLVAGLLATAVFAGAAEPATTEGYGTCTHNSCGKTVTYHVERKEATCTKTGNIEYYICECGACYHPSTTEAGKIGAYINTEAELKLPIDPNNHEGVHRTYPGSAHLKSKKTCESYAVYYKSCSVCEASIESETFEYEYGGYGAHTLVKVSYVAPTYKATGVKEHYKCSVCGALFWDKDGKKAITNANDVVIPKLVDYYYGAALYFNTNGGSSISAIYTTTTKTVDLTKYIPTRRGYTFAGWYADAKLTTPITSITLYPNGYRYNTYNSYTVYAGWYDDTWCSACSFWDVDYYDWYHDEVRYVVDNGIMEGISSRYFAPEEDMTRADLVVAMYRIAGSPSTKYAGVFTDVKSTADYALAVEWAAKYGIVNGVGNKKFDPNSAVTREQMAAIFYRFANYVDKYGYTPYRTTGFLWNYGKLSFKDSAKISAYAKDAVAWSAKNGIFYGDNSNRFNPQSNTTRAECAAILYRFCK